MRASSCARNQRPVSASSRRGFISDNSGYGLNGTYAFVDILAENNSVVITKISATGKTRLIGLIVITNAVSTMPITKRPNRAGRCSHTSGKF